MMKNKTKGIDPAAPPSGTGCVECLAGAAPGWWLHLRRCALCGHIGCCDNSPGQHASAHHTATRHRVLQSFEPDEDWFFDFDSGDFFDGPMLAAPRSHPADQSVPGPDGVVPADWRRHLHQFSSPASQRSGAQAIGVEDAKRLLLMQNMSVQP